MKKTIVLLAALFIFNYSFGAAIIAGDLRTEYSYFSNTYITSVSLFNDCAGTNAPDSVLVNYQCISNSALSFIQYAIPFGNTGYEVIDVHDTAVTTCNGGTALGYKKYKYIAGTQLDSTQDWKIYISIQGRGNTNSCITSSNDNFYMESYLYLSNGINSHPITNDEVETRIFTTYYICKYSFYDGDGDSLSYQLINPLLDSINAVPYNYPYTAGNFMPSSIPITLDSITGQLCFNASINFTGITKLEITEWRSINGQSVKVGISQQDLLVHSYIVYNNPPVLSGMDFNLTEQYNPLDTVYTKEFFAGDTIHFQIHAYDIDSGLNSNCSNADDLYINNIAKDSIFLSAKISFINNGTDSSYIDFLLVPQFSDISQTNYNLAFSISDHWMWLLPQNAIDTFYYHFLIKKNPLAIPESMNKKNVVYFPNPANDFLNIQFNKIYPEIGVNIIDTEGRLIKNTIFNNKKKIMINLQNLSKGSYIINIRTDDFETSEVVIRR